MNVVLIESVLLVKWVLVPSVFINVTCKAEIALPTGILIILAEAAPLPSAASRVHRMSSAQLKTASSPSSTNVTSARLAMLIKRCSVAEILLWQQQDDFGTDFKESLVLEEVHGSGRPDLRSLQMLLCLLRRCDRQAWT
jgi:hypothetical protein